MGLKWMTLRQEERNGDIVYSVAGHENVKAWTVSTLNMVSVTLSTADDSYCSTSAHRRNGQTIIYDTSLGDHSLRRARPRATPTHCGEMLTQPQLAFRKGMLMDEYTSSCCS